MPRMMHLRVVSGTGGGPEKTILNSPKFIRQHGYDAEVVYLTNSDGGFAETLRSRAVEADCPLTILDDRGPFDVRLVGQLSSLLKKNDIQLLQSHDYKSNALALLLAKMHRIRLATMLHGWTDMSGRMPLYKRIDQWCLPRFKSLICVSEDLVEECRRLKIPQDRIHLVHNAIDTERFSRRLSVSEAKRAMGCPQDRLLIGTVGRLSPEKGILNLLECLARLHRAGHPCDLWIAGDGPQREEIEQRVSALGLQSNVRLLGQLTDTRTFYEAMDLFVLNSIREGLPNVVLEAMALGAPVIATRIAGIPFLIRDGETGRLIDPESMDSLYSAISECLRREVDTNRWTRNSRELIERQFSFSMRMQRIAGIYDALLSTAR